MREEGPNLKFERHLFLPGIGELLRPMVGFERMHEALVAYVSNKLHNGEMTERGLARLAGVSQPHLHHVLKGTRLFSAQMADRVMSKLHVDLLTLLAEEPGAEEALAELATAVPLVEARLGPGRPFPDLDRWQGVVPFLRMDVEKIGRPLAVRAAMDVAARHLFEADDVLLLDRLRAGAEARADFPAVGRYYAVDTGGSGLVRQVERKGDRLWLRTGGREAEPVLVELGDRNVLEVVRARVVWIGRYLERRS